MDHHAYVRFHDHHAAEQAFHVMDGRTLFGKVSVIHDFLWDLNVFFVYHNTYMPLEPCPQNQITYHLLCLK